jgi:hypothetical protein
MSDTADETVAEPAGQSTPDPAEGAAAGQQPSCFSIHDQAGTGGRRPMLAATRAELHARVQPETVRLIEKIEAGMPSQATDEFTRVAEGLMQLVACTSLPDEEAAERVNQMPSGTLGGWQMSVDPACTPAPCLNQPNTHRHVIFEVS